MHILTATCLTKLLFLALLVTPQGIGDSKLICVNFTTFGQLLSEESQRTADEHRGSGRLDSTTPASVQAEPNYLARRGSGRIEGNSV